jgi:hypothetical protein
MFGAFLGKKRLRLLPLLVAALATIIAPRAFPQTKPGQETPQDPWQAAPSAFRPDLQRKLSARSDLWEVSLTGWKACPEASSNWCYFFRIEDKLDHKVAAFRLANQTAQVDALSIVGRARLAILGRPLPNMAIVTLVDLPSGKEIDRIVCGGPSLSPDRRFFVYVKFVPAHPGYEWSPSAEYLVYDLSASPEDNRTPPNRARPLEPYDVGWPLYPEGMKNTPGDNIFEGHDVPVHWMVSPFVWFGKSDRLAFVDRWQGVIRLVVGDLRAGIQHPKVNVYPIETVGLLDLPGCKDKVAPSDFEGWSKDPSTLINITSIEVPADKPWFLRLQLAPQPCLAKTGLDVPLSR